MFVFSNKFLSLTTQQQHKHAAQILKQAYIYQDKKVFDDYHRLATILSLDALPFSFEHLSERYHYHLAKAGIHIREHLFLPKLSEVDATCGHPFLDITIYLDNLRLSQNVGSIIRTTEAFRIGTIYFGGNTPFIDQKKVQDAAMGTCQTVHCHRDASMLKHPFIALETVENAKPAHNYVFPSSFTLIIGNEEYGVSKKNLYEADDFIQIPLLGKKNSINVACAFAIIAAQIRATYCSHHPRLN
ncbi:MAG: TrmH family RNA methyltransferase [Chlamydiales bacterium]|nr:TrmH family RNA methyltransferase [Chlamydiales bacterium]